MKKNLFITAAMAAAVFVCAAAGQACAGEQPDGQEYMTRAQELYRAGQKHMLDGNFTAANDAFMKAETVLRAEESMPVAPASYEQDQSPPPEAAIPPAIVKAGHALDPNIYYNLGVGALQKGDFVQAEAAFLRVVELAPLDKEACYNLGVLYEKYLDRPKEALKFYRRYVDLADDDDRDIERVKGWIKEIDQRARER